MSVTTTIRRDGAVRVEDGFDAIYEEHHGRVFGLAYKMMGNADDASDVTQDAFITAYQNLDKLAPRQREDENRSINLPAWLHRVTKNKCIDALRKRNRRVGMDWETFVATAPASATKESQPEIFALERERSERIQAILNEMSPNYRRALLLHEGRGLSVREVAATMGRTESAVKALLFRAREQFRSLHDLESVLERAA